MKITQLKDSPRVSLVEDFLTEEESSHLIEIAEPTLQPAEVIDAASGDGVTDDYRTGKLTGLRRAHDLIVKGIEDKIAASCGVRLEQLEYVQVNRYDVGEQFKSHHDWFDLEQPGHQKQMALGGQRIMSVLIYLNEPAEGGETLFDSLNVRVAPKRGAMLVWLNVADAEGRVDQRVSHRGLPVLEGEKWVATCWVRERAFDGSEEEAHAKGRVERQNNEADLKQKLKELSEKNVEAGYREIMEVCQRRNLVLVPKPRISDDGRVGAVLDLVPGGQ